MGHPNDDPETAPTRRYSDSSYDEEDDLGGVDAGPFGSASSGSSAAVLAEAAEDGEFDPEGPTIAQSASGVTRATPAETAELGDSDHDETVMLENETMAEIQARPVSRRLGGDFQLQRKIGQGELRG